jgi:hypothetical protein
MSRTQLYGMKHSHAVLASRMALELTGIGFAARDLLPGLHGITVRAKGFPAWTVPALEIDGRKIQGTRAIAGEIDRLAPGAGLFSAAFDAIGGGSLAGDILTAMERAQPPLTSYTPYRTTVHKQVYVYGSLDFSPTVIDRRFGLTWSVGGYLLTTALARLGGEAIGRMRARVLAEAKTTFASRYAQTIGLNDVLQPEVLAVFPQHCDEVPDRPIQRPSNLPNCPPSPNGRRSVSRSTQRSR